MKNLLLIFPLFALLCSCTQNQPTYINNRGIVFGTNYNITYQSNIDLEDSILARLKQYDQTMSVFNKQSLLWRVNRNETDTLDSTFIHLYTEAYKVYEASGGAFDITVEPLCHLWKFDADHPDTISVAEYDSIFALAQQVKTYVGMNKTHLEGGRIVKDDPRICFDANAIAEGYGIDLAAQVLEENGIENYMVELGGELHIKGLNPRGEKWRIGIDKPNEGVLTERENEHIIAVTDCAISTSGSYRQYYYRADGRRLSHTIDPRTGEPSLFGMKSVTIVGPNTMTTDAYSTTCMVLGIDEAKKLIDTRPDLEAFMIYDNDAGEECYYYSDGYKALIISQLE